jgi:very-short-patch-repair endonuclease
VVEAARPGTLSHTTAAALLGLDLLGAPGLHVTAAHHRRVPPDVTLHRAKLDASDTTAVAGLATTTMLRTVLDSARRLPHVDAVVLADAALRAGLDVDSFRVAARDARGPRSSRVRAVAAACDPGAESALESLLRLLLAAAGLHPETQAVIRDDRFVARVDFLFREERLVVEADGFRFHSDRTAYRNDRRRGNALLRAGYRVARFSWEDVRHAPDHVVTLVERLLTVG